MVQTLSLSTQSLAGSTPKVYPSGWLSRQVDRSISLDLERGGSNACMLLTEAIKWLTSYINVKPSDIMPVYEIF